MSHDGKTVEEAYIEKMPQLQVEEGVIQDGQVVVKTLLTRCLLWVEIVEQQYVHSSGDVKAATKIHDRQGKIDEHFQDTYDKLRDIRDKLEQMNLTQAWSLRETDLYSFQRQLDRVDEGRVDGNFLNAEGKPANIHSQRVCCIYLQGSWVHD